MDVTTMMDEMAGTIMVVRTTRGERVRWSGDSSSAFEAVHLPCHEPGYY